MGLIHTGLLILRLAAGIMLLLHGISKIMNGIGFIVGTLQEHGIPGFFGYAVYLGEVLGPLLVIIGFRTRLGAILMFINMLVAILLVHSQNILKLNDSGAWAIENPALFLFIALALIFTGGGDYAASTRSRWD